MVQIKPGETLTGKDRVQYLKDVIRARNDPVWFFKEKLGWQTIFKKQEEIARTFYQHLYDPTLPEYKKLIGKIGQRAGKSALGAKLCGFEFFKLISLENPAEYFGLMKNQRISVNCVAASKKQAADNLFGIFLTDFEENEWIQQWFTLKSVGDERIECKDKHVFAEVAGARIDSGAATGATSAAVFGDEVDLWHNQTLSKLSASLVWSKMINSTQSLGIKGKCFAFSSVQDENGMINQLYTEGLDEATTLTYDLCTWEVNDLLTKEQLLEEYKYKMDMFWRDFANQPSASSGYVFPGNSLKLNTSQYNIFELEDIPEESQNFPHVMSVDPAFRNDSFGVAVGYRDNDWVIVDGVWKFQKDANSKEPYVKPSEVEDFILEWIPKISVETFIYDVDLVLSTVEKLERDYGVTCIKHLANEETYSKWVNLNDGLGDYNLSIPYNEHLRRECKHLTKFELPSGKLRIDHPKSKDASKDLADAVSNVVWWLSLENTQRHNKPIAPVSILRT